MKKLIILLISVIAVGAVSVFMLQNHADMQKSLPTTFETAEEEMLPEDEPDDAGGDPDAAGLPEITFSPSNTFYGGNIGVELTCSDENAVIYYTTNGNDPDSSSKKYTEPITLSAKSSAAATTIKAMAVTEDGRSATALKSYIVGKNISERFTEDTLVFVLSTDEYNLYDYYNGIATEGYLRDEWLKNEYTGGEINPTDPANYNVGGRESERDMYVEVYDSSGAQLISQAAGARVVGGYSRANDQKSFRLFARSEYGKGKFKYPFFGVDRDAYGNILTYYDRITLRDGANDREFAGVRDELSAVLASDAGFIDVQSVRPAAVFLNSEYYGFAWLHEAYSGDYLEMMYGGSKENFRIVGDKELEVESDDPGDEQAVADWKHVVELAEQGLVNNFNFAEFRSLVDIDDLMLYYAMQIYIDNKDWPGNNFKVWRYYPAEGETVTSGYLDGKWRFLLFDAEFAWSLYGAGYRDDTLKAVLTGRHMQGASHILGALLERADMREKFANTLCELMGGAFSPDNVKARLDELLEESDPEQMYALENGYISQWANEWSFADSRQQIRDFAEYRPVIVTRSLKTQFKLGDEMYKVSVRCPAGGDIKLGSQTIKSGGTLEVSYFGEYGTDITALPYNGRRFVRWTVNGVDYDTPTLHIDASMARDGVVNPVAYFETTENGGGVVVSELYTSGSDDWAEIYNPCSEPVKLKGWRLSDKPDEPDKYVIPDVDIPAGGTVTFVCKDNNEESALMRHQLNFSLKTGETLYFSDPEGNIVSAVPVTELAEGESLVLGEDGLYRIDIVSDGVHSVQ
ncbi:MAG: CotH kinase family protein [Ruminiclostridium sp.]|nr:CotH kinase family protein [Ruminiclostridium sp.]